MPGELHDEGLIVLHWQGGGPPALSLQGGGGGGGRPALLLLAAMTVSIHRGQNEQQAAC